MVPLYAPAITLLQEPGPTLRRDFKGTVQTKLNRIEKQLKSGHKCIGDQKSWKYFGVSSFRITLCKHPLLLSVYERPHDKIYIIFQGCAKIVRGRRGAGDASPRSEIHESKREYWCELQLYLVLINLRFIERKFHIVLN